MVGPGLPYHARPVDDSPVSTADLPANPTRDRSIPAGAWREAPPSVLTAGDDLPDAPEARYLRRIGRWLLWRAGPATHADARYVAVAADDLATSHSFRLRPDGAGEGLGPSGASHDRFRTWKEDLRDHS